LPSITPRIDAPASRLHTLTPDPATPAPASQPLTPIPANRLVIGYSVEGRPLEAYRFGNGPLGRMIVAGIHGGYEWNTIALADELLAHLAEHPEIVPADVTLHILRSLNPDGEARSRGVHGRVNANGVDLNRNWQVHWQAAWPQAGCWKYTPITGGSGPASEKETRALMNFIVAANVEALISYHSAALGIFAGGLPSDAASLSLADAAAAVSDYPYPPLDTGCQYTGQLIDWASYNDIAALDIELTNHRDTDFKQNLDILNVFLNWRRAER